VRKTGDTLAGASGQSPLVRVFAVAVVFVVVFSAAGYELTGPGSVVNPRVAAGAAKVICLHHAPCGRAALD
jgi:hypothetical protein